jgi:hypothetical protein
MPLIKLTRDLARRASWDAANRAMRAGGRKAWNEDDANIAAAEFNRLWPLCPHMLEPESWCHVCDREEEARLSQLPRSEAPKPQP